MTEELNFEFYLIARYGYDYHIGQHSLVFSNAFSLLVTLLYMYAFELVNIHQMPGLYNAILTNTAFRMTV